MWIGYQPKFGEPLVVIEEKNNFLKEELSKYGVEVEFCEFENGPSLLEALSAGGIDAGYPLGDVPFATSAAAGNPVIGVAAAASDETKNFLYILEDDNSGIETVEDLSREI